MRRYWIEAKDITEDQIRFTGDVFHHIFDVCRQEVGSKFEVIPGNQKAFLVEVTTVDRKSAIARILESREIPALPGPRLVLAISVPRYQVMDAVVEKAVEMGVARIQPFFSDYSFVRKASSLPAGKGERWEKIVKSATQQCGRGDLMVVSEPCDFTKLPGLFGHQDINQPGKKLGLFAYEAKSAFDIKNYLARHKQSSGQTHLEKIQEIWVFVGSEGGFSQTEVQQFKDLGLESVTLGEQVLRVETACIALIAILKYEFGMMLSGG